MRLGRRRFWLVMITFILSLVVYGPFIWRIPIMLGGFSWVLIWQVVYFIAFIPIFFLADHLLDKESKEKK